jgi:hypothetical protein
VTGREFPLQVEGPRPRGARSPRLDDAGETLAHEHLVRPGSSRDPGREVDRPSDRRPVSGFLHREVSPVSSTPDLEQVKGRFFAKSKPKRSSKCSYDEAVAARLWQVSADLVGLSATS